MLASLRLVVALPAVAALCLASRSASADGPFDTPPPRPREHRYNGLALYAGGGAGALADIREATQNWRLAVTVPLTRWMMFEGSGFGFHFVGQSHHKRESSLGLGIGAGLRFAPPVDRTGRMLRPYGALRFVHVHLSPDLWGVHEGASGAMSRDHTSVHRWGGAVAAGFDAAPFRRLRRLRLGLEAEALLLSGPGANVGISGIGLIGVSL